MAKIISLIIRLLNMALRCLVWVATIKPLRQPLQD